MPVDVPVHEVIAAARALSNAGGWQRAAGLLDAASASGAHDRARLALAAAEVAREGGHVGVSPAAARERLRIAEEAFAGVVTDAADRWDLAFLRLRLDYFDLILGTGQFQPGPAGKDIGATRAVERSAEALREAAPDDVRGGWAEFYLGLVADNLYGERGTAPAHYEVALRLGEAGDLLLAAEALRHLGDHDHDDGDHERAFERWGRATALGARVGNVGFTLAQQMLLAVLARDVGDEAGAVALAREIARWAGAIGAVRIEAQAHSFLRGADPTAPPDPKT
jgi:tetratricopeptide (TPR) repeat protein